MVQPWFPSEGYHNHKRNRRLRRGQSLLACLLALAEDSIIPPSFPLSSPRRNFCGTWVINMSPHCPLSLALLTQITLMTLLASSFNISGGAQIIERLN